MYTEVYREGTLILHLFYPCPHCGVYHEYTDHQIKVRDDKFKSDYMIRLHKQEAVYYECPNCKKEISEEDRAKVDDKIVWAAPEIDMNGFHQMSEKINLDGTVEVSRNTSVPCGKCYACLSNRKAQWVFRLQVEVDNSLTSWFITLSQDNEHLEDVNKPAIQLFFRYLRRKGHKFKYYAIGEYGSHTYRPRIS